MLFPETMTEQRHSRGFQEAVKRIDAAKNYSAPRLSLAELELDQVPESIIQLSDLRELDLSRNQLHIMPDSLGELANLQYLNISFNRLSAITVTFLRLHNLQELLLTGNSIVGIPDFIGDMVSIQRLSLGANQIEGIPHTFVRLVKLADLELGGNAISSFPDILTNLLNLQSLELNSNMITDIPDSIARLQELKTLNLSKNRIDRIPNAVGELVNLENLIIAHNAIAHVPESLSHLTKLRKLILADNQIAIIAGAFGKLINITEVNLANNRVDSISESFGALKTLVCLDLSGNQLAQIPASFGSLISLQQLYLRDNQLVTIPDSLSHLSQLKFLDLTNNRIADIPISLGAAPNLTSLFLHGNELLRIPDEILGPTSPEVLIEDKRPKPPKDILSYLGWLENPSPLNEAKLIMVGQGGVGKTSLVKKLITGKFRSGEKTTQGIKISDWKCELNGTDKITVHIWDFGGQEMMHATHQFFLTQRTLYLLVLNRRQGGPDREADYWFRLIRAFGGKDAPVVVVLNKQRSEPFNVNRGGWLQKYSENIRGFVETDCTDSKSIIKLKAKIQLELKEMKSIRASFPRRWFAIKDELSHMSEQYVTFDKYRAICRKHHENNLENQTSLAGFLHDLGIALNYKDDPRLRFAYVLKPEWVTEGIYGLLHAFVRNRGLFAQQEAERVLARRGYSKEAAQFILGLMELFELSLPFGDNQKRILVPQLLDDQQPDEALSFEAAICLNFGYQYTIVPDGLLPRFIVRTHHLSQPTARWKSGVILHDHSSGCRALIRADTTDSQVRIHIDGPQSARHELLAITRYNFDVIHSDYEFKPVDLVYPVGAPEKPLQLGELETLARSGTMSMPMVLEDNRVITPTIASLMEPLGSTLVPLKLFLSYAHQDERYLEELRKRLRPMERSGLIRTWHDRALTPGERWEPRIVQELNDSDVVVCQLSPDFIDSDYCMLTELSTALRRKAVGEAELVAYVLRDCAWKQTEFRDFQVLPRDGKHLRAWRDKDEYWTAVAEGIQSALKELQKKLPERRSKLGSIEAKISGVGGLSASQS